MNELVIQIFPILALSLFIAGEVAQLIKILTTKKAKDISRFRYMVQIIVGILFAIYYIILGHYIVLAVQQILLAIVVLIFILCKKK